MPTLATGRTYAIDMRKRDWAGSIVVAALIALAGFLHAHAIAVALLAVMVVGALLVIAFDVGREKGAGQQAQSRTASRSGGPSGSIVAGRNITAGGDVRASGDISAGVETPRSHPESWLAPEALGSYLDQINKTMEEKGFGPSHGPTSAAGRTHPPNGSKSLSWSELNEVRVGKYEANRGLFLVHTWKPCDKPDQVADVVISIAQHSEHGPLSDGTVSGVQYTLGPQFSEHSHVITNPKGGFATSVSMYGTMLCLAEVCFTDGGPPLLLERYIDFDGAR